MWAPRNARRAYPRHQVWVRLHSRFRYVSEAIPRGGAIIEASKIALEAYLQARVLRIARKINEGLHQRPEALFFRADERDRQTDIPEPIICVSALATWLPSSAS